MHEHWFQRKMATDHQARSKALPEFTSQLHQYNHPETSTVQARAKSYIKSSAGSYVIDRLDEFTGIDMTWLAQELIDNFQGYNVALNLDKFETVDRQWLVKQFIGVGDGAVVVDNLDKFPNLNLQNLAEQLFNTNQGMTVLFYLDKFATVDRSWLADRILQHHGGHALLEYLEKFSDLDQKILVEKFIRFDEGQTLINNLEIFDTIDSAWLADFIQNLGYYSLLIRNIEKFPSVDLKKLAEKLLAPNGQTALVANNLEKFSSLDPQWLAEKLMHSVTPTWILYHLRSFPDIDLKWLVKRVLTEEPHRIAYYLDELVALDQKWLADQLFEYSRGYVIVQNLEYFTQIDQQWLVEKLIEQNQNQAILQNLNQLSQINKSWLLEKLLSLGSVNDIVNELPWFIDTHFDIKLLEKLAKSDHLGAENAAQLLPFLSHDAKITKQLVSKIYQKSDDEGLNDNFLTELTEYQTPEALDFLAKFTTEERNELAALYKTNKFYKSLQLLIKHFGYDAERLGWTWETIVPDIYALIDQNNLIHARDLLICAAALFPNKKTEVENIGKTLPRPDRRPKIEVREKYEALDCTKEIYEYYVSLILINSHQYQSLPKETKDQILDPIESLFNKVREYILLAVSSEIRHSHDLRGVNRYGARNGSMYQAAKSEDVRLFLERCAPNFRTEFSGLSNYGGVAWANIADFGKQIWADEVETNLEQKIFLLNIIVGIQHNGGYFFDKDPSRVQLRSDDLEKLLNFEASENHDLTSFLQYGLDNEIIDSAEADKFIALNQEAAQQKSLVHLSPHLTKDHFARKISLEIKAVLDNQQLPHEIRLSINRYFSKEKGFAPELDSFTLLGRLLGTMNVQWQEIEGPVKKYQTGANTLYEISIEGYKLGYWYQDGQLKLINNIRELSYHIPQLSDIFRNDIVKAQFGYLTEGD